MATVDWEPQIFMMANLRGLKLSHALRQPIVILYSRSHFSGRREHRCFEYYGGYLGWLFLWLIILVVWKRLVPFYTISHCTYCVWLAHHGDNRRHGSSYSKRVHLDWRSLHQKSALGPISSKTSHANINTYIFLWMLSCDKMFPKRKVAGLVACDEICADFSHEDASSSTTIITTTTSTTFH